MTVQIRLFGTVEVTGPRGVLTADDFPSRKARQVFCLLAVAAGRPLSKEGLIEQVWGDRLPRDPVGTVEQAVSVLRRALLSVDEAPIVLTVDGRYRIDTTVATIDVDMFDRLLDDTARTSDDAVPALVSALALATGDVLDGETGAWADAERARCRTRVEQAAVQLARAALAVDDAETAASAARRARETSTIVLDEAYRLEVAALVRLDRPHAASKLIVELERRARVEERRAPRGELEALRELVGGGARSAPAASIEVVTTLRFPPGDLPFVGRAEPIDTIERTWGGRPTSVVSVEAVAGAGRTRLLAELAARRAATGNVIQLSCTPGEHGHELLTAARLLHALARRARVRRTPTIDGSSAAAFAVLVELVERLGPTVVLVDDVHHADPASVALLQALAAPHSDVPIHLVVTLPRRTRGMPGSEEWPDAVRVVLDSLTAADVELLGITSSGTDTAWTETHGHPATLAACAAAAARGGRLDDVDCAAIAARVEAGGDLGRTVARVAARLDQPVDVALLAGAAGLALGTVQVVTAGLIADRVLVATGDGRVGFVGDVVRRVIAATWPNS